MRYPNRAKDFGSKERRTGDVNGQTILPPKRGRGHNGNLPVRTGYADGGAVTPFNTFGNSGGTTSTPGGGMHLNPITYTDRAGREVTIDPLQAWKMGMYGAAGGGGFQNPLPEIKQQPLPQVSLPPRAAPAVEAPPYREITLDSLRSKGAADLDALTAGARERFKQPIKHTPGFAGGGAVDEEDKYAQLPMSQNIEDRRGEAYYDPVRTAKHQQMMAKNRDHMARNKASMGEDYDETDLEAKEKPRLNYYGLPMPYAEGGLVGAGIGLDEKGAVNSFAGVPVGQSRGVPSPVDPASKQIVPQQRSRFGVSRRRTGYAEGGEVSDIPLTDEQRLRLPGDTSVSQGREAIPAAAEAARREQFKNRHYLTPMELQPLDLKDRRAHYAEGGDVKADDTYVTGDTLAGQVEERFNQVLDTDDQLRRNYDEGGTVDESGIAEAAMEAERLRQAEEARAAEQAREREVAAEVARQTEATRQPGREPERTEQPLAREAGADDIARPQAEQPVDPALLRTGYAATPENTAPPESSAGYGAAEQQQQPEGRSDLGRVLDHVRGWFGIGGAQAAEAPATGYRAAPLPPPSTTESTTSSEQGMLPLMYEAGKKAVGSFLEGPKEKPSSERGFFDKTFSDFYSGAKEDLAGYIRGDKAIPPDQLMAIVDRDPTRKSLNRNVQQTFDDLVSRGNMDEAGALTQGLRKGFTGLMAQSQAAVDQGKLDPALQGFKHAHDLLTNGREVNFAKGEGGNIMLTFSPDPGKAGDTKSYNLSPQQFANLVKGPGMHFDNVAENGLERDLDKMTRPPPRDTYRPDQIQAPGGPITPAYPMTQKEVDRELEGLTPNQRLYWKPRDGGYITPEVHQEMLRRGDPLPFRDSIGQRPRPRPETNEEAFRSARDAATSQAESAAADRAYANSPAGQRARAQNDLMGAQADKARAEAAKAYRQPAPRSSGRGGGGGGGGRRSEVEEGVGGAPAPARYAKTDSEGSGGDQLPRNAQLAEGRTPEGMMPTEFSSQSRVSAPDIQSPGSRVPGSGASPNDVPSWAARPNEWVRGNYTGEATGGTQRVTDVVPAKGDRAAPPGATTRHPSYGAQTGDDRQIVTDKSGNRYYVPAEDVAGRNTPPPRAGRNPSTAIDEDIAAWNARKRQLMPDDPASRAQADIFQQRVAPQFPEAQRRATQEARDKAQAKFDREGPTQVPDPYGFRDRKSADQIAQDRKLELARAKNEWHETPEQRRLREHETANIKGQAGVAREGVRQTGGMDREQFRQQELNRRSERVLEQRNEHLAYMNSKAFADRLSREHSAEMQQRMMTVREKVRNGEKLTPPEMENYQIVLDSGLQRGVRGPDTGGGSGVLPRIGRAMGMQNTAEQPPYQAPQGQQWYRSQSTGQWFLK